MIAKPVAGVRQNVVENPRRAGSPSCRSKRTVPDKVFRVDDAPSVGVNSDASRDRNLDTFDKIFAGWNVAELFSINTQRN